MSFYVVDVEASGPIPNKYSMISFAAVKIVDGLKDTFYSDIIKPISHNYIPEIMDLLGIDHNQAILEGKLPKDVMKEFDKWIEKTTLGHPIFVSDNNGFDWQFINYYFHMYLDRNPFGWSSRRIGDIVCGIKGDAYYRWKHLRNTKHTHHPLDDAMGNAEVMLKLKDEFGFKIGFK